MLEAIYHFDWNVFQWIEENLWNPVLDVIFKVITVSGDDGIIFILMGLIFLGVGIFKKNDKCKQIGVAVLVSLLFMEVVNNLILKELIARVRPFNFDWTQYTWGGAFNFPEIVHKPSSWSFPSGHSSSAFAACVAVFWYNKKIGTPAVIYAALMAFSRVYVHVHYCTDVIGGSLVGILYAIAGVFIAKALYEKVLRDKVFAKIEDKLVKEKN
ncbi:MAG: phosphatase PAP2 family protein [Ruminococcaceae bacterium]|nr:phosphatase PAP2 family protein [Oscillospiraceae bacterium]